jgi:hypothetical protein
MAMTTSYNSGGQALVENYQFVARDMYMTDARLDQSTQTRASSPDYTSQDNAQPNQTTSTTTSGTPSGGPTN